MHHFVQFKTETWAKDWAWSDTESGYLYSCLPSSYQTEKNNSGTLFYDMKAKVWSLVLSVSVHLCTLSALLIQCISNFQIISLSFYPMICKRSHSNFVICFHFSIVKYWSEVRDLPVYVTIPVYYTSLIVFIIIAWPIHRIVLYYPPGLRKLWKWSSCFMLWLNIPALG